MTDWAARIIDPGAFIIAHSKRFEIESRKEIARAKAKAIVEMERERCALIADGYRENAEKINAAPGRDAACMMIATDIRNSSEKAREVTDKMIERAARVHNPFAFEPGVNIKSKRDEARKEVREILEAALNPSERT